VQSARAVLGQAPLAWMPLSVAPAATLQALLFVVPTMAAFLAAGEMALWWPGRTWVVVAPVVILAWLEAVLGLVQFSFMKVAGGTPGFVSGTYAAYDHYAGLLEMAFPLAAMGALGTLNPSTRIWGALRTVALLGVAGCLLVGIILSLSRMGTLSTLCATAGVLVAFALSRPRRRRWLWLVPIAIPLLILVSLSSRELLLRFADLTATKDITQDVRMRIWANTLQAIRAYPWTGCGLGTFERGLYQFKTAAPEYTVAFAHNDYLQMTAELGIPGVLLLGGLVFLVLGPTLRVVLFQRKSPNWYLMCGLLGTFLAIAVHSLADFNLYVPANALAFGWLAGLSRSLAPAPATKIS
jgi:O-antigen ligase